MLEPILKILPIIILFIIGFILKYLNLFKKEDADTFLKLNFYIAIPALIIISITKIQLQKQFILFPIIAILIILATYFISKLALKYLKLDNNSAAVFLIATMIMNLGFAVPFVLAFYGEEGIARLSLIDIGNAFMTFTFVYFIACKNNPQNKTKMLKKIIFSPPLIAVIIAIILNIAKAKIPETATSFLQIIGYMSIPLIMLSLGIYFSPKLMNPKVIASAIAIRMLFGFLLGYIIIKLFNIQGLNSIIILIAASAPIGYNTVTFSSLEKLDIELAATLVSYSIIIGLIIIPILLLIL